MPSAPEKLKVKAVTSDSVTLQWSAPASTGGAPITAYTVEKRDMSRPQWSRVMAVEPKEMTCTVTNLLEGRSYLFRVMAENSEGLGEPATIDKPVVPEHEVGELYISYI